MKRLSFLGLSGCALAGTLIGLRSSVSNSLIKNWAQKHAVAVSTRTDGLVIIQAKSNPDSLQELASLCSSPMRCSGNTLTGQLNGEHFEVHLFA